MILPIYIYGQPVLRKVAGALPLNTLANAVLAKSDQMRQMAERNYGEQEVRNVRNEAMENAECREVIQRSR